MFSLVMYIANKLTIYAVFHTNTVHFYVKSNAFHIIIIVKITPTLEGRESAQ